MEIKKRMAITVESFEKIVIKIKQNNKAFICAKCNKSITDLTITKIVYAYPVADNGDAYIFITDSGFCFVLDIS